MELSSFPDWTKIGRRIGKRLRDILDPPKNTGPSKEERREQRLRDVLKGFTYFDTFDEVFNWTRDDVHPVQPANTPLLKRSRTAGHTQAGRRAKLILCHDYHGGYHDYESVRPDVLQNELYSCHYLQYVDTFIYFSHKLVSCPPPTWINLLHRNGVKVLGTFIVEPQTQDIERMLECEDRKYTVAHKLAMMADALGFDGWLLNIEQEFPDHVPNLTTQLCDFIYELKRYLSRDKSVIWYDALNTDNEVEYQNGLTTKNAAFAKDAEELLTNYKWTTRILQESTAVAEDIGISSLSVSFGIDVWAQNTNMPGPPRVTYPAKGGGGTNTGLAVRALAQASFSATVFAPAWTHEHFSTALPVESDCRRRASIASQVDRSMWEGFTLPKDLGCDCHKGKPHHTAEYQKCPIIEWAVEYPAGSESYLQTDFVQPFRTCENGIYSALGSQAVLPHLLPVPAAEWENLRGDDARECLYACYENDSFCIRIKSIENNSSSKQGRTNTDNIDDSSMRDHLRLALFKLDMICNGSLHAIIEFNDLETSTAKGFYFAYEELRSRKMQHQYHEIQSTELGHAAITLQAAGDADSRLVECGVYCQAFPTARSFDPLLRISSLCIKPIQHIDPKFEVVNVQTKREERDGVAETWITWEWQDSVKKWPRSLSNVLPWSSTTGPFAYFSVEIDGKEVGRAHCLQFPLRKEDLEEGEGEEVVVGIGGYVFGSGTCVRRTSVLSVSRSELRLEVVGSDWCLLAERSEGRG
ncbi:MAG: hypothetical protein Q9191_007727 [Dirinaria sp. TL-2023a]